MLESIAEKIYFKFKEELLSSVYSPGNVITEQTVADKYGTSKTPAREALARLANENFLTKHNKIGYFIKCTEPEEFKEIMELRLMIESNIIKKIIAECSLESISELFKVAKSKEEDNVQLKKYNLEFHLYMAKLTNNSYIYSTIERLLFLLERPTPYAFVLHPHETDWIHIKLVEAMLMRNEKEAIEWLKMDLFGKNLDGN